MLLWLVGRGSKLDKAAKDVDAGEAHEEVATAEEEVATIHERLLKVSTKDYGRYDPAPALVRPPFKLIPN
ncbi:hypothetical protein CDL15_Pgr004308 [Punica granatum]|uniref:Uncharacterized protein n=1 Tax=Punica granatum TaxID=22663 RepID=A0A218XFY4_PUNGR|nr:hypothetical protein CDL15_Pgr004308 [Punica granatum]PKI59486.1 hypothetical protein CRG98_020117 [Punica granatum]